MSYLPPLGALLLPLTALLAPALAQSAYTSSNNETPKDNNANCSCYVVNSGDNANTPSYFQYYRFYDFRNLPDAMSEAPPLVNDTTAAGLEPVWQPSVFNSAAWNADWGLQNWSKPATDDFPTPMNNSMANIYLGKEDDVSFLSLRTSRQEKYQTAGEIENQQKNLMHVSMRMYGRVRGDKGAVAGFFTFVDDTNESDIEILTDDPTDQIRYTNQPAVDKKGNEIAAASVGPTNLPSWENWQTHRIDWLPKHSYWYLNNEQVAANTYSVPRKSSFMVLNMWSDGGEWSGKMDVGGSAEFHIQWIEMTFNTSGPYDGGKSQKRDDSINLFGRKRATKGCQTVCKIDDVAQVGTPEVVSTSSSGAMGLSVSWGFLGVVGVVSAFVGM
ncbi:glycoside hydrolase family 16 protein [Plenodomus tracheiphilus IPT5]|uniref:Glycoside hydrolase family 16 protein n=1 Tax=Plenodomus tracheiphilus IPT5 TaxID=1408161 RepID=A0A6A7BMC6_9PLEO|nr:glycoside hydrolase family 16 protein [Plenodomus tracheiphilus IPT5]